MSVVTLLALRPHWGLIFCGDVFFEPVKQDSFKFIACDGVTGDSTIIAVVRRSTFVHM